MKVLSYGSVTSGFRSVVPQDTLQVGSKGSPVKQCHPRIHPKDCRIRGGSPLGKEVIFLKGGLTMSVVGLLVACSEKLLSLLMFPLFDFSFLSIPVVYSLLPKPAIFPCA